MCVVGTMNDIPANAKLTIITNTVKSLYSAFKNAKAPS